MNEENKIIIENNHVKVDKKLVGDYYITCMIGITGTGKTSIAQYLSLEAQKNNIKCWSNMPLYNTQELDFNDLMHYEFTGENEEGIFLIDEGGIDLNNRDWKDLSKDIIKFFKYHRHFRIDVYVFSQGEDIDITLRRLAHLWYKIEKPRLLLGRYCVLKPVYTDITIVGGQWKLIYQLEDFPFAWRLIPIYKAWAYFNSYSRPDLPKKQFNVWYDKVELPLTFKQKFKTKISNITNFINKYVFKAFLRKKSIQRIKKNIAESEEFKDTTF
jgi:hypothetical protein